jgi:hypothetical protein
MPTIAEMRARLAAKKNQFQKDDSIYAFWNMPYNSNSTLRLLPWVDPVTGMIWTEKQLLPMTFIDPQDNSKTITFKAPCREMYDPSTKCPVADLVRAVYNECKELKNAGRTKEEEVLSKIASKHWKDFTYYYQGFVNKSGFQEENLPENPIRRFPFTKQIQGRVTSQMFDETDPFDVLPTGQFEMDDLKLLMSGDEMSEADAEALLAKFEGYDLLLKKTQKPGTDFAEWTNTAFVKAKTSLTDEQLEALDKYGFHDLRKALPEQPSDEAYDVLCEMMEISLAYARGEGDGLWNTDWEAAGFKPFRPKAKGEKGEDSDGDAPSKGTSSIANRVKAAVSGGASTSTGQTAKATVNAASVAARLKNRGAATPSPAPEAQVEAVATAAPAQEPETVAPAATTTDKVLNLAAKIRAKAKENRA